MPTMVTELTTERPAGTHVGAAIAAWLSDRGTQRKWLATRIGVRQDTLTRLLSGEGRGPAERLTPDLIRRIAHALDVPRAVEAEWLGMLEGAQE